MLKHRKFNVVKPYQLALHNPDQKNSFADLCHTSVECWLSAMGIEVLLSIYVEILISVDICHR